MIISLKKILTKIIEQLKKNSYFIKGYTYGQYIVNSSTSETFPVYGISFTTYGRPVFISFTGDFNPDAQGNWIYIRLYRDDILLHQQVVVGQNTGYNTPMCLNYLDPVEAGTYVYKVIVSIGSGSGGLNEEYQSSSYTSIGNEAPQFIIFEI